MIKQSSSLNDAIATYKKQQNKDQIAFKNHLDTLECLRIQIVINEA